MSGATDVGRFEVGELPRGRSIRRFTSATTNQRAGAGIGELLGDVYYAAIIAAIGIGIALGVTGTLREALPDAAESASGTTVWSLPGLSLPALVVAVVVGLAGVVLSLSGRLGPVSAGGPEATWWLPLPVERRGLLRPAVARVPAAAALVSGVAVGVLDAGVLAAPAGRVLPTVLAAALGAAVVVLGASLGQTLDVSRRATSVAGDLVLAGAVLLAVVSGVAGWHPDGLPAVTPLVLVGLAVAAGALVVAVDLRLDRIPSRSLRAGGAVASQAVGAVVSLDTRELGRALTDASLPRRRRASRLRIVRGPSSALVVADALVVLRSPRRLVLLLATALVPVLVGTAPALAGPVGFAIALVVGGFVATTTAAEGARRAEMAPVLDRLLPLGARDVRLLRMVVPAVAMIAWSLVAFGVVGLWHGDVPGWLALGVAAVPVWAGAAVRAAYRPAPDWSAPLVSTPMGAIPTGVTAVLARGPDVLVLGLVPVLVSIFLGHVHPEVVVVQTVLSLVVVAVATSTRTLAERMGLSGDAPTAPAGGAR
ncbi:DUF6297 family protein [Cellulomonas sp. NPDC055163]